MSMLQAESRCTVALASMIAAMAAASDSAVAGETVPGAAAAEALVPTTTTLVVEPKRAVEGEAFRLTAVVTSSSGVQPSGRVEFFNNGALLGTRLLDWSVARNPIAVGTGHACAVTLSGRVMCWGHNEYGQLGNGTFVNSANPVEVIGLTGAVSVSAGGDHTCAVTIDGRALCWGNNWHGQLGIGSSTYSSWPSPRQVLLLESGVLAVSAGRFHTCAIQDVRLACWGKNDSGQVGIGDNTIDPNSPQWVLTARNLSERSKLSAGGEHTCIMIVPGGATWCWGSNSFGQFGNGRTDSDPIDSPIEVRRDRGRRHLAAGFQHSCIIRFGEVWCFGRNGWGQLGNGSFLSQSLPMLVGDGINASVLAPGHYHTCAAAERSGGVWCWGANFYGQLGDGTTRRRNWPRQVLGLPTGIRSLATGYTSSCAATDLGRLYCWGYGQTRPRKMQLPTLRVRGKALASLSKLAVGRHVLKAVFTGSTTHAVSRSKSIAIIVQPSGRVSITAEAGGRPIETPFPAP